MSRLWLARSKMKILLVRLDGIGDALACTPLVAALRDAGHLLGIALTLRNAAVFAAETFAWTHVLERRAWPAHGHAATGVDAMIAQARTIAYDLALVASEEPDAYVLAERCAPRRIGFINGWEKPLKTFILARRLDRAISRTATPARVREHEVETMFGLGAGLTQEVSPTRDVRRLLPLVCDSAVQPQRTIAVQLSPKWTAMRVSRSDLTSVVRELARLAPVRLLASGEETAELRSFGVASDGIDSVVFHGADGMRAWKRAIAEAGVLITPDSGAAHVAGMTGTPCVDVFPHSSHVRADMRRWRPWAARSALLIADRDAPVVSAARDLLETRAAWPKNAHC